MGSENSSDNQVLEVKIVDDGRKNVDYVSRVIAIIGLVIAIIGCFFAGATYYRTFMDENIVISDFDTDYYFTHRDGYVYLPVEITFTNRSAKTIPIINLDITHVSRTGDEITWADSQELIALGDPDISPINVEANSSFKQRYFIKFIPNRPYAEIISQNHGDEVRIPIVNFMKKSDLRRYYFNIEATTGGEKEISMFCSKDYIIADYPQP